MNYNNGVKYAYSQYPIIKKEIFTFQEARWSGSFLTLYVKLEHNNNNPSTQHMVYTFNVAAFVIKKQWSDIQPKLYRGVELALEFQWNSFVTKDGWGTRVNVTSIQIVTGAKSEYQHGKIIMRPHDYNAAELQHKAETYKQNWVPKEQWLLNQQNAKNNNTEAQVSNDIYGINVEDDEIDWDLSSFSTSSDKKVKEEKEQNDSDNEWDL